MLEKRKRRLIEAAGPHLGGEQVREVMVGQSAVSPLIYLLVGPIVLAFFARPRVAMVTDQHVYMFEGNMWSTKKLNRLLEKHPVGRAPVSVTGLSLTVGNQKSYALLFQFGPMKRIAELAKGGAPQQSLEAAPTA
jgi:hypothetical protein